MFSAKLKEATKPAHQSLEKIIIRQIRAIQTPADYKKLLQFFFSYYHPLEQMLEPFFTGNDIIPGFTERRKAAAILYDIQQNTAASPLAPDDCNDLPRVCSVANALGIQYVLEGSTLGGAFISKMLYQQASIPETQLSFFTGYAEKTLVRWQAFIDALNAYVNNYGKEDEIIDSANECFQKFEHWAQHVYPVAPEPKLPSTVA